MAKGEFIFANFAESWATRGGAARLYDEPMTLSSTQKAAWAAVLSEVRGGRTLPPALQAALVDFFAEAAFAAAAAAADVVAHRLRGRRTVAD